MIVRLVDPRGFRCGYLVAGAKGFSVVPAHLAPQVVIASEPEKKPVKQLASEITAYNLFGDARCPACSKRHLYAAEVGTVDCRCGFTFKALPC